MARYRVNEKSFIGNMLVEEGGEVEYDGVPGSNLDPLDAAAERAVKAARQARAAAAAPAVVHRTGQDLASPFTPANPTSSLSDEGRRADVPEGATGVSNPQGRRADPQPEVGPTEAAVNPAAARRAQRASTRAAERGAELRENTEERAPPADPAATPVRIVADDMDLA